MPFFASLICFTIKVKLDFVNYLLIYSTFPLIFSLERCLFRVFKMEQWETGLLPSPLGGFSARLSTPEETLPACLHRGNPHLQKAYAKVDNYALILELQC